MPEMSAATPESPVRSETVCPSGFTRSSIPSSETEVTFAVCAVNPSSVSPAKKDSSLAAHPFSVADRRNAPSVSTPVTMPSQGAVTVCV